MSYTPNNSIDRTNLVMDLLAKKQQAIGANLANVNTPGYVRQDLDFSQFISTANGPLETKLSRRLGPSPIMKDKGGEVSTAQEMIDMQKNLVLYTIATRRMSELIQELKTISQVGR